MLAAAASTSSSLPAILAAIGSLVSACLLGWVAVRAQSAREQLEQIRRIVEDEISQVVNDPGRAALSNERVKRALREVLGEDPRNRRWYDRED